MSSIKLKHSGGNSVSLNPPTSAPTSSDVAFKLPNADGSAGDFLKTDGSGNLAFLNAVPILKYATFTHDGYVSGSFTGGAPSSTSMGYQLFSTSYTPAAADSTCVVISSSVTVGEATNFTNHFHLSLFNGSTFVSAVGGGQSYTAFEGFLNSATLNYVGSFSSGSTSARNIMMRVGCNDSGTLYINGNPNSAGTITGSSNRFTALLVELAA
jgi:hypothetical protein